jgi:hypothetical protein
MFGWLAYSFLFREQTLWKALVECILVGLFLYGMDYLTGKFPK